MVKEILKRSGLSQAELARRAGMPRSVVNVYAKGHREPGANALARLAAAGGCSLSSGRESRRSTPTAPVASRGSPGAGGGAAVLPQTGARATPRLKDRIGKADRPMSKLVEKLYAIHDSLTEAGFPTRSVGQSRLPTAWRSRGEPGTWTSTSSSTRRRPSRVLAALPDGIRVRKRTSPRSKQTVRPASTGMALRSTFPQQPAVHEAVASSVVWVPLEGREAPVLDCARWSSSRRSSIAPRTGPTSRQSRRPRLRTSKRRQRTDRRAGRR